MKLLDDTYEEFFTYKFIDDSEPEEEDPPPPSPTTGILTDGYIPPVSGNTNYVNILENTN